MEEYRCLLPQAVVADGEMVLCRIHLAHSPPAAARQESNAYRLRRQEVPGAEPVTATAQKRPAPIAAAADLPCSKKMRIAAPVPVPEPEAECQGCPMWFTPAASAHVQEWPAPVAAADPPCSNNHAICGLSFVVGHVTRLVSLKRRRLGCPVLLMTSRQ